MAGFERELRAGAGSLVANLAAGELRRALDANGDGRDRGDVRRFADGLEKRVDVAAAVAPAVAEPEPVAELPLPPLALLAGGLPVVAVALRHPTRARGVRAAPRPLLESPAAT